uniref:Uncharacterized protein n=1 Tax=Oryza sativa subsp. japonica TaxID=39947 RepID=Q7EYK2_ORYSJ|nr:hypothetical protein [Oryza sativa Japonica Group]BAD30808.1 hypothetical protein [Oryza sativa Japonica Group]
MAGCLEHAAHSDTKGSNTAIIPSTELVEKTVADVIKGEGRRRQAGPTGQRHKGAGPPWTGTTEAVHRRSTGTDGPDRPKPIGRPGAARLGHSTAQSRLAKRRRAAARPPAATAGDSAGRRGGMLTKGGDGETTTRKPAAGSSGRQRWSGGVPRARGGGR